MSSGGTIVAQYSGDPVVVYANCKVSLRVGRIGRLIAHSPNHSVSIRAHNQPPSVIVRTPAALYSRHDIASRHGKVAHVVIAGRCTLAKTQSDDSLADEQVPDPGLYGLVLLVVPGTLVRIERAAGVRVSNEDRAQLRLEDQRSRRHHDAFR